jgi:hypothetical protein
MLYVFIDAGVHRFIISKNGKVIEKDSVKRIHKIIILYKFILCTVRHSTILTCYMYVIKNKKNSVHITNLFECIYI